jgi:tagatose-6-phosphate ketose/aldose isomerase
MNAESDRFHHKRTTQMHQLAALLQLPQSEQQRLGTVYTPHEISTQADTWPSTLSVIKEHKEEIRSFLEARGLRGPRNARPTVSLIGAGTSDYIGRCICGLLRECWDCDVEATPSTSVLSSFSEFLVPERPRIWISISRSGNSPEGVAVLERALSERPEISHVVISCDETGKMTQLTQGRGNCLSIVLRPETNDKGLAMTASFTNMVVCGQALANLWSLDSYGKILAELCEVAPLFLSNAASLAKRKFARACFLGSGVFAGVASESALKLLELTAGRIKTMSETTLGLRHGPMAALDRDTILIQFLSTDETRRSYELDLLHEIESKGLVALTIAVNGAETCELPTLDSTHLLAPDRWGSIPDFYRPVLDIMFGQCLGLFASLEVGLTPDTPSPTGAINRVVPAFEIH